jgi:hypothetical protein
VAKQPAPLFQLHAGQWAVGVRAANALTAQSSKVICGTCRKQGHASHERGVFMQHDVVGALLSLSVLESFDGFLVNPSGFCSGGNAVQPEVARYIKLASKQRQQPTAGACSGQPQLGSPARPSSWILQLGTSTGPQAFTPHSATAASEKNLGLAQKNIFRKFCSRSPRITPKKITTAQ